MKISVVIPTYNRRESLALCLEAVFDQDLPSSRYEVVVVVDGSRDGTSGMLQIIVEQKNRGQATARNAGVNAATGEIVLFLDDDFQCDRGLLSAHLLAHEKNARGVVFGRTRGILTHCPSLLETQTWKGFEDYYRRFENDSRPKYPDDAWVGPNCSMSRSIFLEAGGYDEKLFPRRWEDVDLGLRLWKQGAIFRFEGRAVASHRWVKSRRQFWIDTEEDGASIVRMFRRHPEMRAHSIIAGLMGAPAWKRLAARTLTSRSAIGRILLDALVSSGEKLERVHDIGARLFRAGVSVILLSGARREAGSWRLLANGFRIRLPVLLYHHVGFPGARREDAARAGVSEDDLESLTVTPAKFARQMRWLHRRGYTAITPRQWLAWRTGGGLLPEKPVLLCFDDAYADIGVHALPVLEQYGFQSAIFVITKLLGGLNAWEGLPTMSVEQIKYWTARGMEIGAHSRTHPELTAISGDLLVGEVAGSKEDLLEAALDPVSFAYPFGCYDDRVRRCVEGIFPLAFTCDEGLNHLRTDPLLLRRTMVQPGDTLLDIELRVAFGWSPLNRSRAFFRLRSRLWSLLRRVRRIYRHAH